VFGFQLLVFRCVESAPTDVGGYATVGCRGAAGFVYVRSVDEASHSGAGEAETRHGGGVFRWVWIGGMILVFYVLSIGPVAKLIEKGVIKAESVEPVYLPLSLLGSRYRAMGLSLQWYMTDVWGVK
jgi:hypothetical protein